MDPLGVKRTVRLSPSLCKFLHLEPFSSLTVEEVFVAINSYIYWSDDVIRPSEKYSYYEESSRRFNLRLKWANILNVERRDLRDPSCPDIQIIPDENLCRLLRLDPEKTQSVRFSDYLWMVPSLYS